MGATGPGQSEKDDRKGIRSRRKPLTMLNFKSGVRRGSKKILQRFGRHLLAGRIAQHHDAGLVVLGLPGVQKSIGGGEGLAVSRI